MSEMMLSSSALDTALFIVSCFATAREWIIECLLTSCSNFLFIAVRLLETAPDTVAIQATGVQTKTPKPVIDIAIAPADSTVIMVFLRQTTD